MAKVCEFGKAGAGVFNIGSGEADIGKVAGAALEASINEAVGGFQ